MKNIHENEPFIDQYGANYSQFTTTLYQEIRHLTYGADLGQNSWLTVEELHSFILWLDLSPDDKVLDIACGSGGPAIRLAKETGCHVHGVDINEQAIKNAKEFAIQEKMEDKVTFEVIDANKELPFFTGSFDCVICIDSINHFPDRLSILKEWKRILRPYGKILFTDPIVVTGPLSYEEIKVRSSIGYFLFVPPEEDVRLIKEAGFVLLENDNHSANMCEVSDRWLHTRENHEKELRAVEGDETYEGQQNFFRVTSKISNEGRLSRYALMALKLK